MSGSLKEFKNWWIREAPFIDEYSAEEGWKAALKWVLKTTDEHYYAFEDKFDVYKMIKEELNAKT